MHFISVTCNTWDLKLHYDWGENFHEGRAAVLNEKKAKWGFIDKNGILVIPAIYDKVYFFSEGLAFVKKKANIFILIWMGIQK